MRYVLDASVRLKTVLLEGDSNRAIRLRDDAAQGLHELISPDFFPTEIGHALTRAERRKIIKVGDAAGLLAKILLDLPHLEASLPLLPRAVDISSSLGAATYDCLYVALAEREGIEMVTADQKLLNNLGSHFPFIVPLSLFPI
jgi:predicted nucleic acid-binding protein